MSKRSFTGSGSARVIADYLLDMLQKGSASCELVDRAVHATPAGEAVLLVFDKFYWRNNSRASLTVLLLSEGGRITADCIAAGGSRSSFTRMNWGAEADFADAAAKLLLQLGFTETGEASCAE